MNLSIHQYRVTPLRSSAELHLGVGHGTRHDLFLPSLYPLRHPTRKVVSGSELLSSALVPRKVRIFKTASPGRLLSVACFSVSLSSFGLHRVGVPASIHESLPNVKHIFHKFFIFLSIVFQKH